MITEELYHTGGEPGKTIIPHGEAGGLHLYTRVFAVEKSQVGGQWEELACKHLVCKHVGKQGYLKTYFIVFSSHP